MKIDNLLRTSIAAALIVGAAPSAHATAPLPEAEAFFMPPAFSGALLSPSGRYVAIRLPNANTGFHSLNVYDTEKQQLTVVAKDSLVDAGDMHWVNDERIVFGSGAKLWAVNADGSNLLGLMHTTRSEPYAPAGNRDNAWTYVRTVGTAKGTGAVRLVRLNTLDNQAEWVDSPPQTFAWTMDEAGKPRFARTMSDDERTVSIHLYDDASKSWRKLASFDAYIGNKHDIIPHAFSRDGVLYVLSNKGEDKRAVYTMDLATGKLSDQPVVRMEDHDFDGRLLMRDGKLSGIRYHNDRAGTHWLDPDAQAAQDNVDALLPNAVNTLHFGFRKEAQNVLVESYSDVQPRSYWLFNRAKGHMKLLGREHSRIKPEQMGRQESVTYAARDGLKIPAVLTMPQNSQGKPAPMVLLVHGGPWRRAAYWGWDPQSQFLASRGYAVLEPDYRGSIGYGTGHWRAGWKQWGQAMQNDLADGVRWAIAQGYADPKRICIAGGDYGGYAALMGLVKDPELYQCAFGWRAITDVELIHNGDWLYQDMVGTTRKGVFAELIGDPAKDAAMLKANSPLAQAARIGKPVLLAYGDREAIVTPAHGVRLRDAAKGNKDIEVVEYPGSATSAVNHSDFWRRAERLLERTIGPGLK